ncbi:hypothetical protein F5X71_10575 [Nocardia brasiliensis]|uniref:Twitching motility protein PilT n=1 Tax=Nocardia brasiliensis TaxID=37326 RepID=A0A6G9XP53_NOCBR|nr:hypothetical protein [Nocardia brasiliensis]QIS02707.1 hypothetical protein F5X71_10575 [Nocardia brasiliensis]
MIGGVVLDVAAVVGACLRDPYPEAVVWSGIDLGNVIAIPAAILTEAEAHIPPNGLDILDVLLGLPNTVVPVLDQPAARRFARLLAAAPDHLSQIAAAHAVSEAVRRDWPVTTNRGGLLTALSPDVRVDAMP